MATVFILGGAMFLTYGLLDILSPSTTIRWQVRSTAKHGGVRRATGEAVQRAMGFDSATDPGGDPAIRRNISVDRARARNGRRRSLVRRDQHLGQVIGQHSSGYIREHWRTREALFQKVA
jgi:hypothetical protein